MSERGTNERLRLWLERSGAGFRLRDAATGELVRGEDPRIRVIKVAGVSYRLDALQDDAFAPGRRLALVPEPDNEHDPPRDRRLGRRAQRAGRLRSRGNRPRARSRGVAGRLRVGVLRGRQARRAAPSACASQRLDRTSANMIHEIPLERRTLHGHFSRELAPVAAIDSGDTNGPLVSRLRVARRARRHVRSQETRGARRRSCPHRADRGARARGPDARRPHRRGPCRVVRRDGRRRLVDAAQRPARHERRRDAHPSLEPRRGPGRRPGCAGTRGGATTVSGCARHAPARAGRAFDRSAAALGRKIDCKELVAGTTLFCRFRSTAHCSRPATVTHARETARSRRLRSSARSTGSSSRSRSKTAPR